MVKSVPLLITIFAAVTWALPTLKFHRGQYFNLAVPICVTYNATDGLDGRSPQTKALSTHPDGTEYSNDWIGLYVSGACKSQENYIRPSDDHHSRGDDPTSGMVHPPANLSYPISVALDSQCLSIILPVIFCNRCELDRATSDMPH